jgi:tetratricopeptide repeat protein 14 homolog
LQIKKGLITIKFFLSVKDAADYLKMGKPFESHQAVNKALLIDPENVDGLIVRACMFAGTKNFVKALEDFEKAYSINPLHVSIKKYLTATLLEYGRM